MIVKNLFGLHLMLLTFFLQTAHANDVWDYARERSLRTQQPLPETHSERQGVNNPKIDLQQRQKKNQKRVDRPVRKSPLAEIKPATVAESKTIKNSKISDNKVVHSAHQFDSEVMSLGLMLKKIVNTLKATPSEKQIQSMYHEMKKENISLNEQLSNNDKKLQLQQSNLQQIQRKLKELQSPSLPLEKSRREVFVAGMASGYSLLELIDERKKQGAELNKVDFLEGIKEVFNEGKRLPENEFQSILASINTKIADKEREIKKRREENDSIWLADFRSKSGATQNKDGIWYRVNYKGDRPVNNDETVFVALSRKLTNNEILFDSDINDKYFEIELKNLPDVLSDILKSINLHGEVVVAMPVDANGKPDTKSNFIEQWNLRLVDAGIVDSSTSS